MIIKIFIPVLISTFISIPAFSMNKKSISKLDKSPIEELRSMLVNEDSFLRKTINWKFKNHDFVSKGKNPHLKKDMELFVKSTIFNGLKKLIPELH